MKAIGIIPARFASTRFPGKPLVLIKGVSLIERVYRQAVKSKLLNKVVIATDDMRIYNEAKRFGADAVMTSVKCKSGTDRLAETAKAQGCRADLYVNIQGDEPLISPSLIDKLVIALKNDPAADMATACFPVINSTEKHNPNAVKVVVDKEWNALYFSRYPVPFERVKHAQHYKHIGIYAYRRDFLLKFSRMKQTPLEKAEQLEQLRVLENGFKIKVVRSQNDSIGVDTPQDIKKVERIIK